MFYLFFFLGLEYTSAAVVRGNKVRIGPGCAIDLVEYAQDFQEGKGAEIKGIRRKEALGTG